MTTNVFGLKYCAFSGKVIEDDYVLVKHKHIINERTSTRKFGMFNQHQIHTTTTTYFWEAYYVDALEYRKYKRSIGFILSILLPTITGIAILCFLIMVGMQYETFDFKFPFFGFLAGAFAYYILHKVILFFVKPTLKEIGLVDSIYIIDSYLEEKHPKIMKMINWLETNERDDKTAYNLRFSHLPEF